METKIESEITLIEFSYRIQFLYEKMMTRIIQKTQLDIRPDQVPVMFCIHINPTISQQEIANCLDRDKASMTRTIKNLVGKGYITTSNCPIDNRKNTLTLTPKGNSIIDIISKEVEIYEDKIHNTFQTKRNLTPSQSNFGFLETFIQSYKESLTIEKQLF